MRKLLAPVVAAAAAVAGAGGAHAQGPASTDPTAVQAGLYVVEPEHTQVGFSVLHLGFSRYDGVFSKASGQLKLDPKALAATSLDVSVPVASVQTTSPTLDGELKSERWLNAAKYPTMRLRSTSVTQTGASTATVAGELTLHGVTRPVTLKARFVGAGVNLLDRRYTAGFFVTGIIRRSDFGVSAYGPLVSDQVGLTINAAFEKASGPP